MQNTSWVEISEKAILNNLKELRKNTGGKVIIAPCIKGNAYGHGIVEMARLLNNNGINWLCVTSIEEAALLRASKINGKILIIGPIFVSQAKAIIDLDCHVFLSDIDLAERLNEYGKTDNSCAKIFIKVDTGMCRQGVTIDDLDQFLTRIIPLKNLKIDGIATHFGTSDDLSDKTVYPSQTKNFKHAIRTLAKHGVHPRYKCAGNTSVAIRKDDNIYNMVRPGISIYGYYPSEEIKHKYKNIKLKQALTFKSELPRAKARGLQTYSLFC